MATAIAEKKPNGKPSTRKPVAKPKAKPERKPPALPNKYRKGALSVRQAANELALSDTTVLRAIASGKLLAYRIETKRPYFLIASGDLAKYKVARLKTSR